MKGPTALLFVVAGTAAAAATSSEILQPRDDFCGTDQYGTDWYCTTSGTECCVGSVQGICIPEGYTCCDTGFFCSPDESCVLDRSTNIQYCVGSGSDSDATSTASSDSAGQTRSSGDDDDDDSAAIVLVASKAWMLMPFVGAVMVWL